MNFELNEEQRAFVETAQSFALEKMAPFAAEWDEASIFPTDILREAGTLGFGGIYCRDDVGGTGLGRLESTLIFEELAAACPSTAAYISIHNMASWMIDCFGNQTQREQWVPDLCKFHLMASYCLSEPNSGSDAASLETNARLD